MTAGQTTSKAPGSAGAVSEHLDTRTAATEVAHQLHDGLAGPCDLAFVFASYHHRAALPEAVDTIRQTVNPGTLLAVTTEGVVGGNTELEGVVGFSALALRLPGVSVSPWFSTPEDPIPLSRADEVASRIHLTDDFRTAVMIGDPFSTPITRLLPAIGACGGRRAVPLVGGMASGASQPGHNRLILNDRMFSAGVVGVSIAGAIDVNFVVSQGCRPFGRSAVVTKAKSNVIQELGGRPALEVLREMTAMLKPEEQPLLKRGLLFGQVIDESKRPFGRGDFLVRNVLGIDQESGAITVGDLPRLGQTVQFHLRDATTASEDLQLLLDAQELEDRPFAALLFTCNGRGRRLFGEANHDVGIIQDRLGGIPLAGFFAAGEVGPIGDQSFLHGHTAALAMFRQR